MCGKAYKKVFDQSANILWAKFFLDTFTAVVYMAFGGKPEGDKLLICTAISWGILYVLLFARGLISVQSLRISGRRRKMPFAEFFASLGLIGAVQFITGWLMEGMDILKDSFGIAIYEESISAQELSFLAVLMMGVIAPVLEEILFRGIIMRRIGGKIGMCGGIFFSALLFGLCHMNVEQGTAAFLAGLVFGLAAWKYSLYPAALLHVINNLYGLLFKIRVEDQDLLGNVLAGVAVLGLIVAAIILLRNKGSAEGIFRKKDKSVKWRECFASKRFAFLLIVFSVLTLGNSIFS